MVQPKGPSKSGKLEPTFKTYTERIQDLLDKRKSAMQELCFAEPTGVEYSTGDELLNAVNKLLSEEGKRGRHARGLASAGELLRFLKEDLIQSQCEWKVKTEREIAGESSNLAPSKAPINSRKRQASVPPPASRKKASSISIDKTPSLRMTERTGTTATSAIEAPTSRSILPSSLGATHKGPVDLQHPLVHVKPPTVPLSFDPPPLSRSKDISASSNPAASATTGSIRHASSLPQPAATDMPHIGDISDDEFYRLFNQEDPTVVNRSNSGTPS